MAKTKTEVYSTEGILLLKRDGATMAIHLTLVEATLEAVIIEPELHRSSVVYSIPPATLDHYQVEAHGKADRLYLWTGPDPFAKREIRNHVEGIEA